MQKTMYGRNTALAAVFIVNLISIGCTKATLEKRVKTTYPTTTTTTTTTSTTAPAPVTTTTSTDVFNVGYNNWIDGMYTLTQATTDFKNVLGWADTRMSISAGRMKTTLLKDVVGPSGGLVSWIDVQDASSYQLDYDLMFDPTFDFSAGGKVGYGFLIGEGYTGGTPGWDGNGGSARIMWYKGWDGRVYLKPYLYYKDQPGQYGNDFGRSYPATGSISKGAWYHITMSIRSNTASNTDGYIFVAVNGVTILDQPIRWTTNDLKRLVNRVCFETFRGGADASWTSTTDGAIFFDNVRLQVK